MASIVKWRTLVAIVLFAEAFTLAGMFGRPAIQGRLLRHPFSSPHVFHQRPPGCIVHFHGNFFVSAAQSTAFWICVVLIVAGLRG